MGESRGEFGTGETGVLPAEAIARLIEAGAARLAGPPGARQIQPASLDLTLGARAFRVRASFLPSRARRVDERLAGGLFMHEIGLEQGAVLERGCVYLVELNERLALPPDICGAANPKSSTGRIDVFVRLVTDHGAAFDEVPAGYEGPLYAEISPRTFSIVVRRGSSLNQLRFKRGDCRLDDAALAALHAEAPLVDGPADIEGGLGLRVRLAGAPGEIVGWRARRHAALIDVDAVGALNAEDYFEPIAAPRAGFIILDPDEFYILASREALAAPPDYAAEMTPINPGLGEFRVHYAGFFDPGFGWSPDGAGLSRAVLEVRSHDAPFVLEDGQIVARLAYERMAARPGRLYGADLASNYQGQGLRLSKHFRQTEPHS
ncbi:2'-deoxycytidine 5'-triphosphate deaminase [Amphiplicatus metriothermophilus]|uniref:dCTP deaminase n=1 Tax=Amphiplicatus metriothermophilus TaxID=1519374 RepID=A0A239PM59_9PROT|nr:2'-deoxycytidine 5'-triphosphate deaminase [Amphiplicatus metriothermophilus]MBB5517481.1 dCTP deaminase [Amphiplicatus metriothermophilus]SNT68184.1 dCTP deaminase [Amphiplicatus metriothermophilus]